MRTDEELVLSARGGEPDAFAQLVERWTSRCWDIAWRILHDRELAADVAQETMVTAWQQLSHLERPAAFGGWVSRIARNRALDRLERERRAVATGDQGALEAYATSAAGIAGGVGGFGGRSGAAADGDPVAELDRADQQALVWAASAALGERDASVLDLHLRHGLEAGELAEELGIAPNAVHQAMFRLRRRLGSAIRAWLLWRGGRPACASLGRALVTAGVEVFGADAVRVVEDHVAECLACERSRDAVVAPAAMFAAAPMLLMPAALGARVLAGLEHAGVPVPAAGLAGTEMVGPGGAGGASAEAGGGPVVGHAASAEARRGPVVGDPASAGAGSGGSAEGGASAEAGGQPVAGHGRRIGVGAAALLAVAALVWFLAGADDAGTAGLAVRPAAGSPAGPPELELADRVGPALSGAPDVLGGQRYAPVRPFTGDRDPAPRDLVVPEVVEEVADPPVLAPDPLPPATAPPVEEPAGTGSGPGGGEGEPDERPDEPDRDPEPDAEPDPAPEPSPPQVQRLRGVVVTAAAGCEELGADVSWATTDAETVELVTDVAVYGGLPPSASDVRVCITFDSYEITLHAHGPDGTTTRVIVAEV